MISKVYLDMDGVLSDFDGMLRQHWPDHVPFSNHLPNDIFWKRVKDIPDFWLNMPKFPGADDLFNYINTFALPMEILTAPASSDPRCKLQKEQWAEKHGFKLPINFSKASEKRHFAKPGHVLIDDNENNVKDWIEDGGIGILHIDLESTLKQLKEHLKL